MSGSEHVLAPAERRVAAYGWRAKAGDSVAILAVILSFALWVPPAGFLRSASKIYVSPTGRNWGSGADPSRALSSIQRAVDLARAGDEIVVLPGHYRERVCIRRSGLPSRPIRLRAWKPGTVVVSGQHPGWPGNGTVWRAEGVGIYSTAPPWPIYSLRADGLSMLPCESLSCLRALTQLPHAGGAFHQAPEKLYVYLPGKAQPGERCIEAHGPVPAPLANGVWRAANVWVAGDYIHLEGIHFDWGVASGVRVWRGRGVVVRHCLLTGTRFGIMAACGIKPSRDLVVEHCAYHNYPEAEWRRHWLPKDTLYERVKGHCLLLSMDDGAVVRHNLVVHANDGVKVTNVDAHIRTGAEVSDNLIAYCTDDAIEFDGQARMIRFRHNLVYDCHESLGTSPVLVGPVDISRNLFLHPSDGINGAQVKLLNPGLRRGPPLNGPIRNVRIHHNTFVGNWLCWWNESPVEDVSVSHNVFAVQRMSTPPWPTGVTEQNNLYVEPSVPGGTNPGRAPRWLSNELAASRQDEAARPRGPSEWRGATPPGRRWTMPRPGPQWLDWRSSPATRPLLTDLAEELFLACTPS